MVDERYCGSPGDLTVETDTSERPQEKWKRYAEACQKDGTPAIVQINHPGRQSPAMCGRRGFWEKTIAPSAIALNLGDNLVAKAARLFLFGTPREMTTSDIRSTIQRFTEAAQFSAEAGFSGVELHGAHGYLIAQFLSSKSNQRSDEYGGSPANRARFAVETIKAIRAVVPKKFSVGIKLNSADHQHANSLEETLEQIEHIVDAGIDFIEISGGTYEDAQVR
jgi:2,4-dienoyl-CoA reductase-like NADH-dependent reductase (Old Yellow Enzyme family)